MKYLKYCSIGLAAALSLAAVAAPASTTVTGSAPHVMAAPVSSAVKAKAALAHLAAQFKAGQVMSYSSTLLLSIPTGPDPTQLTKSSVTIAVSLQRPNKMRLEASRAGKEIALIVSDGTSLSTYSPAIGKYIKVPSGATFSSTMHAAQQSIVSLYSQDQMINLGMALMIPSLFVTASPDLGNQDAVKGIKYGVADLAIAGVPTVDIRQLLPQNGGGGAALTFFLNASTGLPVRFKQEILTPDGHDIPLLQQDFEDFKVTSSPLAQSAFAWSPPATAQLASIKQPQQGASTLLVAGAPAPDFTVMTTDGKSVKLSDFAGKVVVVDFWATWCGPCQQSLPHTDAIAKSYAAKGVVFLPICSWDENAAFEAWVKAHTSFSMAFYFDPAGKDEQGSIASKMYGVDGIPTQYVVGKDGHVSANFVGYDPDGDPTEKALTDAIDKALSAS